MRIIYKYQLVFGYNCMHLPCNSNIIHIAGQDGNLCMWVEQPVSAEVPQMMRQFNVYGTGIYIHDDRDQHVGSAQIDGFVWHVYETK